jgi:hypothetical protein
MKYRIAWKSPETGETMKGRPLFASMETAREVAQVMNIMWTGTSHWAESAEETAAPPQMTSAA